jgi:hypothetical protein
VAEGLSTSQLEGRLKNAAAEFLHHRLIVPKVFLEAAWPSYRRIDLLAVDRAGSGDIHVVEVTADPNRILSAVADLMAVPAHYKYVAAFENAVLPQAADSRLFAQDGIGRIGVIAVRERPEDGGLRARLAVAPERFRVEEKFWKEVDSFLASSAPDLEIRDR